METLKGSRLLLVEDDVRIGSLLRSELQAKGLAVTWAQNLAEARATTHDQFDLVMIDLGLPDGDGTELVREWRNAQAEIVIVILTARGEEIDVLVGLDAGADDYLVKPVRLAELTARVQAHLRRSSAALGRGDSFLRVGELGLDLAARRVNLGSKELKLRSREYDLLVRLADDCGEAVRRETLMDDVWDVNWFGSTKTLDVHIAALRRVLAEAAQQTRVVAPTITALRGFGYRLDP
ncbi:response regulator transcription factor [Tessaracoccus antarcticus]|uniref:DNA-binding response regulator n=1 Tax=Tessaracoccus antarcticus TaxID=2479848 RepID=A0A3M0FX31_9ACTN|nr:response regulator transcription factor [Tessaracoccus antarcticus]RMB57055.1 DNA-binding response regulator [Tessaracoccus antarcticus]